MSKRLKRGMIAAGAVAVLAGGGAAIAGATGGDDDATDRPISGSAVERASAVALEHVGGGRVTGTEAGDEEGAYEVEITRADGSRVDVHLDRSFAVTGDDSDRGEGDGD